MSGYEKDLLSKALDWSMMPTSERKYTEQEKILYGTYEPLSVTLSHIVNSRAGLSFTTYSHTGLPVPVYTIGAGAEVFDGFYDNTGIYYSSYREHHPTDMPVTYEPTANSDFEHMFDASDKDTSRVGLTK